MSLTASEMTPADIAAVNGGNSWGNGFGGDGWWVILFLIFAMGGNWGNGFGGGNSGNVPYFLDTNNDLQRGFDQSATMTGIGALQNSVNNGFANAEVANCNRAMDAMQTAYNNQIASMNQNFATATELDNRLDTLSMSLQKCCCDNELATESLRYTVATENAADRAALSDGVRDIIASQTAGIQTILDKMCQQELDAERRENDNLRTQLNMANLAASQTAQTARILSDNAAQTQALEQYLNPAPVPAYVVQNPNCCSTYNGCGCGTNF